MNAESGMYKRCKNDYGQGKCPMSPEKLSEDETGRKGAPCEFIHPLVMAGVMCNEKQPRMGRFDAPLKMYGMVIAPHKAANIWDGNCPILRENWDGMMPHRRNVLKCEKK